MQLLKNKLLLKKACNMNSNVHNHKILHRYKSLQIFFYSI